MSKEHPVLYAYYDFDLNLVVADSEKFPLRPKSCLRACSPADWVEFGKCEQHGCFDALKDTPCLAVLTPKTK